MLRNSRRIEKNTIDFERSISDQPQWLVPESDWLSHASAPAAHWRLDMTRVPWLRSILQSRLLQLAARAITLAGFLFVILAGLFGSPVGSHNFAIIMVWIAWWTALKLFFIPFGGRSWCSICPIPMPGEWLQQGRASGADQKRGGLGLRRPGQLGRPGQLRWPGKLRGSWLQSVGFLLIGLFSAVTLTDPRVTAWVLLGLILLAAGLSLVFERRSFCSYICPIGGFSGMYAQAAPVELRVTDPAVCATHPEKTCYQSCPWGVYPLALKDNAACGLCLECLRICPQDNIAVNLRPFGSDLYAARRTNRLDEAFLALVMLGSAAAFSAVFTGPWGALKSAAYAIGSPAWLFYASGFLITTVILLPGLFGISVWIGQKWSQEKAQFRRTLSTKSLILLPLGLCAWIAFTISFALPKASYVLAVISDPFGWGWNLFGTAHSGWSLNVAAFGAEFSPILQVVILLVGLFWSARVALNLTESDHRRDLRLVLPVMLFCLGYSLIMLFLLVG
ncbi:MAG: 4Fe-4S binding protein [Omnitrophica WOR_2 bacterium]